MRMFFIFVNLSKSFISYAVIIHILSYLVCSGFYKHFYTIKRSLLHLLL